MCQLSLSEPDVEGTGVPELSEIWHARIDLAAEIAVVVERRYFSTVQPFAMNGRWTRRMREWTLWIAMWRRQRLVRGSPSGGM